jgi:putative SOS response-associated peptidase YedK
MGVRVTKIQFIKLKQIERELGTLAAMKELEIMKDGFRYSNSLIIRKALDKVDVEIVAAHWEFIPPWVKNMEEVHAARKQGIPWLNATSEKLLDSKMFRSAALKRRCLVLATHFYEWRHYRPDGAKKDLSYPYLIEAADQNYFYMAGIWQTWTDKSTGETMDTFAIVTTKANDLMAQVHNTKKRMPTILPEELAYEWIMDDLNEERIKEIASYQLPSEALAAHPIAKDFKIALDPTAEFEYEDLPALDIAI